MCIGTLFYLISVGSYFPLACLNYETVIYIYNEKCVWKFWVSHSIVSEDSDLCILHGQPYPWRWWHYIWNIVNNSTIDTALFRRDLNSQQCVLNVTSICDLKENKMWEIKNWMLTVQHRSESCGSWLSGKLVYWHVLPAVTESILCAECCKLSVKLFSVLVLSYGCIFVTERPTQQIM